MEPEFGLLVPRAALEAGVVTPEDLDRITAGAAAGYTCSACGGPGGPGDGPASLVVLVSDGSSPGPSAPGWTAAFPAGGPVEITDPDGEPFYVGDLGGYPPGWLDRVGAVGVELLVGADGVDRGGAAALEAAAAAGRLVGGLVKVETGGTRSRQP